MAFHLDVELELTFAQVRQQTVQGQRQLSSWQILRDTVRHQGVRGLSVDLPHALKLTLCV